MIGMNCCCLTFRLSSTNATLDFHARAEPRNLHQNALLGFYGAKMWLNTQTKIVDAYIEGGMLHTAYSVCSYAVDEAKSKKCSIYVSALTSRQKYLKVSPTKI